MPKFGENLGVKQDLIPPFGGVVQKTPNYVGFIVRRTLASHAIGLGLFRFLVNH